MSDRAWIEAQAIALGFDHVRVASVPDGAAPRAAELAAWLAAGHHGDMHYIERGAAVRARPALRMPRVRSVLVLGLDHHHLAPPDPGGLTGRVARYAWGRDYHNLMGKRLRKLQRRLGEAGLASRGGVDTAPILERAWAEAAGLGFNGKNCVQIWPARGSWMFLAALFLEVPLAPDAPLGDHCGRCRRCLDACPTRAFVGPHVLDARRCIAYLTIESRGPVPEALRPGLGRWVFGCDVCQEVCPHNVRPPQPDEDDLLPRNAWLDLAWLLEADDDEVMRRFEGTPLRRPGAEGLRRNACVVLGNLGRPEAIPLLRGAAEGPSALVAEHARWALERLGG